MKRRTFMFAGIGGAAFGATSMLPAPAAGQFARGEDIGDGRRLYAGADLAFGTTIAVQVAHTDAAIATLAIEDALHAAKRIDHLMSLHRPDSAVMRLNRTQRLLQPDAHVQAVLGFAQQLSAHTGGAFDITVQPLWQAYAAAAARGGLPSAAERAAALAATGYRRLRVSAEVVQLEPGMAITLNGLAQGYAVDQARAALQARGITQALLDTGEFGACGRKSAVRPWSIGIRDPRDASMLATAIAMDSRCVATSGDYECTFSADFLHHHIFDPALGASPTELASVTVLAPTGLKADGWSTAFMVMGSRRALALAATLPSIDVMVIDKQGRIRSSAGFPGHAG